MSSSIYFAGAPLGTGVPIIDDGHMGIDDALRKVEVALGKGAEPARLRQRIEVLRQRLETHFADEERLMESHGQFDLEGHRREHAAALDQLARLREAIGLDVDAAWIAALNEFHHAIVLHIIRFDLAFRKLAA